MKKYNFYTQVPVDSRIREKTIIIEADDFLEALVILENKMLKDYDWFSLIPPAGGRIVTIHKELKEQKG
ncbi:MAG: hypothetical protein ISS41_03315 [Candidatus Aminicenantes bacterium]|nr:hypothetical protein [Candidatus Aminicenantes bacterium]